MELSDHVIDWLCPWQVASELADLGVKEDAVEGILAATRIEEIDDLAKILGEQNPSVKELRDFFELAEAAGCKNYLEFDPSVVRGLAYYTGQFSCSEYCSA